MVHGTEQDPAGTSVSPGRWRGGLPRGLLLLSSITLTVCGEPAGPAPGPAPIASVVVSPRTATLAALDETIQLHAVARDATGEEIPGMTFTWWSADQRFVKVDSTGIATAVGNGAAEVRASAEGVSGTAEINVSQRPASLVFEHSPTGAFVDGYMWSGTSISVIAVRLLDDNGHPLVSTEDSVEIGIGRNPGGGSLRGLTRSPISEYGYAQFSLAIDRSGEGYTLVANYPGAADGISDPFDVVGFAGVTTGNDHSCGYTTAGVAYCWGYGGSHLGNGDAADRMTPRAVLGQHEFTALVARNYKTCGLVTGGAAYCWGPGPLGDGTYTGSSEPVPVAGNHTFGQLSAGGRHTCGVAADATLCWGINSYGQLGTDAALETCLDDPCSTVPVQVSGGVTFTTVVAGGSHTCGLTAAGVAYCWGLNEAGQLGDGSAMNRSTPMPVSGSLSFEVLSAGGGHTCGLSTDGRGYCWGWNDRGQLGDGTDSNRLTPVPVAGDLAFVGLTAGYKHTCAYTDSGDAYCWGNNQSGQLGASTWPLYSANPVTVAGEQTFVQLAAGGSHTCGRTPTGALYCWGAGNHGQLGSISSGDRLVPVSGSP